MHPAVRLAFLSAVALLSVGGAVRAQSAEGSYPGVLSCPAGPRAEAVNASITVEIGDGRASYAFSTAGGSEKGSGAVVEGRLVLTGRGTGRQPYEARYVGEVSGRGGLLTGTQTGRGWKRACQLSIGQGRA